MTSATFETVILGAPVTVAVRGTVTPPVTVSADEAYPAEATVEGFRVGDGPEIHAFNFPLLAAVCDLDAATVEARARAALVEAAEREALRAQGAPPVADDSDDLLW